MTSNVTGLKSSTTASGPQYFIVATTFEVDEPTRHSYLQSLLSYQVEALKKHLRSSLEHEGMHTALSAPAQQVTAIVSQNLDRFVSRLEPYVFLYDGWNGDGSRAPSSFGIWQAVLDSFRLIALGFPSPKPKVLSDGTLGVFWREGTSYAAIDFEEDGVHVWTATDGKAFKSGIWDASAEIPSDLKSIASKDVATGIAGLPSPMREPDSQFG